MTRIPFTVEICSGCGDDDRPVSFTHGGSKRVVVEIIDRWFGAEDTHFKLRADDGNLYIIRHRHDDNTWEMMMMEAAGATDLK